MDGPPAPMFAVWLAALDAGMLSVGELVAWADKRITELPNPPLWLIELSLATDVRGIERAEAAAPEPARDDDWRELYPGFLYLAHEAGKLPLDELLMTAGDFADADGSGPCRSAKRFISC